MSILHRLNHWLSTRLSPVRGDMMKTSRARLRLVAIGSVVLLTLVCIRVMDWTIMAPQSQDTSAIQSEKISSIRADIVDRNGVLLATSLPVSSVYADPTLIENKPFIARQLEEILNITGVEAKLNHKGRFVWIKRGITPDQHFEINALGSPGLEFQNETRRFYPQGRTAAHLVGYSSVDGKGLAGIERFYNDHLIKTEEPVVLSMDIRLQYALAQSLRKQMQSFKANAAMGGILDIQTGEILAAVSLPDFDPHHAGDATDDARFNRFANGVYEMGSTFKLFSTAAYLEKTGRPFSQTFDAREPMEEGRFTINDYHATKRVLTVPEVFIHSSNIGAALMGRAIGTDKMRDMYGRLGLLSKVDADFPALATPLIPSPWRDINTLTASYGHGIAVTPLHVLRAAAATVNGGIAPQLSFTKRESGADLIQERIFSPTTSYKMRQLLRLNVTDGSGQKADVPGYTVGGKTGTSEKATADGYDKGKLLSSFIGIFPADNPRYAVLAILDEPKGKKETFGYATGGWTAAPAIRDVIADMAAILALPAEEPSKPLTADLRRYLNNPEGQISPVNFGL